MSHSCTGMGGFTWENKFSFKVGARKIINKRTFFIHERTLIVLLGGIADRQTDGHHSDPMNFLFVCDVK